MYAIGLEQRSRGSRGGIPGLTRGRSKLAPFAGELHRDQNSPLRLRQTALRLTRGRRLRSGQTPPPSLFLTGFRNLSCQRLTALRPVRRLLHRRYKRRRTYSPPHLHPPLPPLVPTPP